MSASTRVVSAGVDWITCTSRDSSLHSPLSEVGRASIAMERNRGNLERPWHWQGYEGLACGSASIGRRQDGTIVRLSSGLAADCWQYLLRDADNVSRLDLQVTLYDPDPHATRASIAYAQSTLAKATATRPWRTTLIVSNPDGQTCYVGSRSSDRYGRVYDKFAESKQEEYALTWRYEVEHKGELASTLAHSLAKSERALRECTGVVARYFEARGVVVPFSRSLSIDEPATHYRRADLERTLEWLRLQVRPAVSRLLAAGYEQRTLSALGLSGLLEPDGDRDTKRVYDRLKHA